MREDILRLLDWVCVEWGFCLSPADADRIAAVECLKAHDFAREVLLAEGMDPDCDAQWYRKIKRRFIDEFGGSCEGLH
jgi:hypothetical protein